MAGPISRRSFAAASLAAAVTSIRPGKGRAAAVPELYVSASVDQAGVSAVVVLDAEAGPVRATPLPARGHDIALRPSSRQAVVFARRPGRFAVAFDLDGARPPMRFDSEPDRHFFGHGVYSRDGRLLLSTENDISGKRGILGIRDATAGYRPLGAFATGGIGPHEVALLADGRTLVVANGGIETDPVGREALNLEGMKPSLAYVSIATGDLIERVELDPALHKLSIRHLAVGAGGTVVFGCQYEGDPADRPPLVGLHRRGGKPVLLDAPPDTLHRLANYVGSIAVDRAGEIAAASSPKGGIVAYWDVASGAYLGMSDLADVCGLAPAGAGEMLLTSGSGALRRERIGAAAYMLAQSSPTVHWDNHVVSVPVPG